MTKPELRSFYKKERKQFSFQQIEEKSSLILNQIKQLPIWQNTVFHCFVSIKSQNEIQTFSLIEYLLKQKKIVAVPKVQGLEMLTCQISSQTEWKTGSFQVPEPKNWTKIALEKIEIVFIPMLICDFKGNRIGYGGGYYDRFLSQLNPDTLKIGLNFFPPIPVEIESEKTDIPLDYCVTPDEIIRF
ncbi:MAG: 5-formyltetrahydrofolate cyclo-ligase [Weeksellaceae bacterium]|nr:5-formyltetrahydrofolate cyclo-ligase [Weeksellaceae bacterium]